MRTEPRGVPIKVGKELGENSMMKSKGTESFRKEGDTSCSREVKKDKNEKYPLDLTTSKLVVTSVSSEVSSQGAEE